jgi:hypothetical protein
MNFFAFTEERNAKLQMEKPIVVFWIHLSRASKAKIWSIENVDNFDCCYVVACCEACKVSVRGGLSFSDDPRFYPHVSEERAAVEQLKFKCPHTAPAQAVIDLLALESPEEARPDDRRNKAVR